MALLRLESVEKSFAGVPALRPATLELEAGEILGLIGENGAGKSTLIKLLSGVHAPDRGTIEWQGRKVRFASPRDAIDAGIATIHQELSYFGRLSVAENLLLAERWPRRAWGGVDWRRLYAAADERLRSVGIDVSSRSMLDSLSAAEKQEVAIARALCRDARLLILDEPTAALSEPEAQRLFDRLRRLRSGGVAIVYVSHRLDEILALTNRVAVLRDGSLAAVRATPEVDAGELVRHMTGRLRPQSAGHALSAAADGPAGAGHGAPLLELSGATRAGKFQDVDLALRPGEIAGLAGLAGSGRFDVARSLFGLLPLERGELRLRGRPWRPRDAADALRAGIAYLPEERKRQALVLEHSLQDAISAASLGSVSRWGLIRRGEERRRSRSALAAFGIRARSIFQPVGTLSGGNQQKAVLARWLLRDPSVLVACEPTRGVDVAARAEIHSHLRRIARRGAAVLIISSDLQELLELADTVHVLFRGRVATRLSGDDRTLENVMHAASGLARSGRDAPEGH